MFVGKTEESVVLVFFCKTLEVFYDCLLVGLDMCIVFGVLEKCFVNRCPVPFRACNERKAVLFVEVPNSSVA